jgi:phosphoglycolate phosphatase
MGQDQNRYRLAIFDLDGTLVDSFPWFLRVVNDVARDFHFKPVAPEDVEEMRRAGAREILKRLEVPLWKVPRIAAHMRRMKQEHLRDIPLFPGVAAMLRSLRDGGIRLALVSSDSEANARAQLGDCAAGFDHFACGASLFGKAEKFKRVTKRAGLRPQDVISIGDEMRDLDAARAAGIAFGGVAWGYADPRALKEREPDAWFETMDEISRILCRGTRSTPDASDAT